jgi:arylsulfatase A-like enzyme
MHFYPWDIKHGFQYRIAAEDKRWLHVRDDYYHFLQAQGHRKYHGSEHEGYFEHKGAIINKLPWELSVDHFVGQEACRFIRTYGDDGPFAMMVGFPGPHCPYDPNPEFLEGLDPAAMPEAIPEVPGAADKLRQSNIDGNRQSWNGVDYTEFTEAQKRKLRLHYAALVKQIDYEVGQILAALREQNLLENTIIIFASDHGDYLGDHNLIGKGTFYEGSIKVPLIAHLPWAEDARTYNGLVELTDVTATLLHLAGCDLPPYLDAKPLPDLDVSGQAHKDYLLGMTSSGWMIYEGMWKLSKYATGEILLFNLEKDPTEQHNLAKDPQHREMYQRLDTLLTQEVMRSFRESHEVQRVYTKSLSSDPGFGKEGWQRVYPQDISGTIR